jgi:hypothetical protein
MSSPKVKSSRATNSRLRSTSSVIRSPIQEENDNDVSQDKNDSKGKVNRRLFVDEASTMEQEEVPENIPHFVFTPSPPSTKRKSSITISKINSNTHRTSSPIVIKPAKATRVLKKDKNKEETPPLRRSLRIAQMNLLKEEREMVRAAEEAEHLRLINSAIGRNHITVKRGSRVSKKRTTTQKITLGQTIQEKEMKRRKSKMSTRNEE